MLSIPNLWMAKLFADNQRDKQLIWRIRLNWSLLILLLDTHAFKCRVSQQNGFIDLLILLSVVLSDALLDPVDQSLFRLTLLRICHHVIDQGGFQFQVQEIHAFLVGPVPTEVDYVQALRTLYVSY